MSDGVPKILLPPLLPDNQLTCIVDDVTAAKDSKGAFGGAEKKNDRTIYHWIVRECVCICCTAL